MSKYDDIINLPHHESTKHPKMSLYDRAAQFSPFAALTGHEAAIKETARLTEERIELDESAKTELDEKLQRLYETLSERPQITVTYFCPDELKEGGAYVTHTGVVKKMDAYYRTLLMEDGTMILMEDIYHIEENLK